MPRPCARTSCLLSTGKTASSAWSSATASFSSATISTKSIAELFVRRGGNGYPADGANTRQMGPDESLRSKILRGKGGATKWSERRFSKKRREQNRVRGDVCCINETDIRLCTDGCVVLKKKKAAGHNGPAADGWAGWIRTSGMTESKSVALPLGDSPVCKNGKPFRICRSCFNGVGDGTRTHDNQNHNLALYQLNYTHHIGAPKGTRTPGPLLRRQLLYPPELWAQT